MVTSTPPYKGVGIICSFLQTLTLTQFKYPGNGVYFYLRFVPCCGRLSYPQEKPRDNRKITFKISKDVLAVITTEFRALQQKKARQKTGLFQELTMR